MDWIKFISFLGVPEKWASIIVTTVVTVGFTWMIAGVTHNAIQQEENSANIQAQQEVILSLLYDEIVMSSQIQEQIYYLSQSVEKVHTTNISLNREYVKPDLNLALIEQIEKNASEYIESKLPHKKMNLDSIRSRIYKIGVRKLQKRN